MAKGSEIDAQLMDFLYGELSESDADRFRGRLAGDPKLSADLEAFQRTREAFKALPEEEPPPAVSAQLLHEAAKRAPARKRAHTGQARPGVWAAVVEFFQPLVRHPAAASIAALLLVGGVAGALYVRGVDSPAHPIGSSEAPAPATHAAEGRLTGLAGLDSNDVDPRNRGFARTDEVSLDGPTGDVTSESRPSAGDFAGGVENSEDNSEFRARLAKPAQEKALRESTGKSRRGAMNKKLDDRRRAGRGMRGGGRAPVANAVSGADRLVVPEQAPAAPSTAKAKKFAAPAVQPTRSSSLEDSDSFGAADQEAEALPAHRDYKNRKDDRWAMSRHGVLNRTLDSKITRKSKTVRCREAARIANDILDRNPEYYTSKVKKSKRLKPCTGFVATERSRRANRRAKAGAGTGGKANAAAKKSKKASGTKAGKAKAAPASEMDAAESE